MSSQRISFATLDPITGLVPPTQLPTAALARTLQLLDDTGLVVNCTLTSETNAFVDVLQLGVDGSGTLRDQHFTTADQVGAGQAANMTMNPGQSWGTNKDGAYLRFASGASTGSGLGGSISFATSPPGGSGTGLNAQTTRWTIDTYGNFFPGSDGAVLFGQFYARLYAGFFSNWVQIGGGTTVAQSGQIRLDNTGQVNFRNAANDGDLLGIAATSSGRIKVGGVESNLVLTGGQAGSYAPTMRDGLFSLALSANFLYFGRFVAPENFTAKSISFGLNVPAGANDNCGAAIFDSSGATRLATSGSVTSKLNAAAGPQKLTIPDTALTAGTTYYVAFWVGTLGGSAAQILAAGLGAFNSCPNLAGITVGTEDYGLVAAASIPTTLAGSSPWGHAPFLFVGKS